MSRHRRASRPIAGFATVAAVLLAIGLSGCSSADDGAAAGRTEPVSGGTLTYLINQETFTLDPGVSPASATALMTRNIFDSLVSQPEPGVFEPWLAREWTVSPDGTVYTFALRDDVTFHDGTAFTAEAVVATLEHIVDPDSKSQNTTRISAYESSRALDDHTVEVVLSSPFRPFLDAVSSTALGIQSPAALALPVEQYEPIGTGPFVYASWDQQKVLVLDRNPDYAWAPAGAAHDGPAYLESVRFDLVTEDATRYGALVSGEAQAIADVPASDVDSLSETPGFQVLTVSAPGIPYTLYLNASEGLTADVRVRRALLASVDAATIVDSVFFGAFEAARGILGPVSAGYDASAADELQGYDPEKAAELLDEAGWTERNSEGYRVKDGVELELDWPAVAGSDRADRSSIAEAIQDQAKEAGIRINRPSVDIATALSRLSDGDYELWDGSNERADPDILRDFFGSDRTFAAGGANISRVDSPQLDEWLAQGLATSDPAIADAAYGKVQHDVLKNAYVLPVYINQYTLGATDALQGIRFAAASTPLLYDAWLSR